MKSNDKLLPVICKKNPEKQLTNYKKKIALLNRKIDKLKLITERQSEFIDKSLSHDPSIIAEEVMKLMWQNDYLHQKIKDLQPVELYRAHNKTIALLKHKIFMIENDNALLDSENQELKNTMQTLEAEVQSLNLIIKTLTNEETK